MRAVMTLQDSATRRSIMAVTEHTCERHALYSGSGMYSRDNSWQKKHRRIRLNQVASVLHDKERCNSGALQVLTAAGQG